MSTTPEDPTVVESLLGAYAVDACTPEEAAAVEALLAERPDLAQEATSLAEAAAWIGAGEAVEPPAATRVAVLEQAGRTARALDPVARQYEREATRVARELDLLDPGDDDVRTPNGLTARELVVHIAAQETLLARAVGHPVDDVADEDIEARTAALIARFADQPYDTVVALWRRAADTVTAWAADRQNRDTEVTWLGQPMSSDDLLVARAFENWTHRDDLRRVRRRPGAPPPAADLHRMAELSMRLLPAALTVSGRSHPDTLARVVLSGDGGGEWLVPLQVGATPTGRPAVTLTADVVDWCHLVAERLEPAALERTAEGDVSIGDDLVEAAPAFAVL